MTVITTAASETFYRYGLLLDYVGSYYHGWQYQEGLPTVEGSLKRALKNLTGEEPLLFAAGRTDAGVHSRGQVVHVDLKKKWDPFVLRKGLNHFLKKHHEDFVYGLLKGHEKYRQYQKKHYSPQGERMPYEHGERDNNLKNPLREEDYFSSFTLPFPQIFFPGMAVVKAAEVPLDFHARFHCQWRRYSYNILYGKVQRAFFPYHWWIPSFLNVELMDKACCLLKGHHNFSHFRHRDCQSKNPWKTLDECFLEYFPHDQDGGEIVFHFRSRSFLHRQVRMMVGALVYVGLGRWTLEDLEKVLTMDKKYQGPQVAPPQGLFFEEAFYHPNPFSQENFIKEESI